MPVDFENEITYLSQQPNWGRYLATVLRGIQTGVNTLGDHLAADPSQTLPAPPPIQSLTVKANNGAVHVVVSDNNAISKHLNYFVEYDTNSGFTQPHVEQLGASRSRILQLPGNDDNGNPQTFHFRAYSQYPGGMPGPKINYGGNIPTAVSPGGSTNLTLIPSTGSGTAQPNGQQGGSGFGVVLNRPSQAKVSPNTT